MLNCEKREIIARVVEVATLITMCTHVYSFEDKLFIQRSGGPKGMRSTASLANLVKAYLLIALAVLWMTAG